MVRLFKRKIIYGALRADLCVVIRDQILQSCVNLCRSRPASWSRGYASVSGAGDLRFKSRAGEIGHSVADGSPPL